MNTSINIFGVEGLSLRPGQVFHNFISENFYSGLSKAGYKLRSTRPLIKPEQAALLREAQRPVVIFSGAIGDHLLLIPALRALGQLFPGKLELVCFPRRWHAYYSDVKVARVYEEGQTWNGESYTFEADTLIRHLAGSDLVMCFNTWYHPEVERFLEMAAPAHSLGYYPAYRTALSQNYRQHTVDLTFDLIHCLDPDLRPEEFSYAPAFPERHRTRAGQLRAELPAGAKLLAVHADTKPQKMWSPAHFNTVLDLFLTRHPEYVVVVVGAQDLGFGGGRNSDRIFTRFQLPQLTALSLMGEADLFLGVDSCMLHAADLYGIPGVSLFGPTTPLQWGFRFSRHHRDLRGARGKMANLNPWQVLEALEEVETEAIKSNVKQIRSA